MVTCTLFLAKTEGLREGGPAAIGRGCPTPSSARSRQAPGSPGGKVEQTDFFSDSSDSGGVQNGPAASHVGFLLPAAQGRLHWAPHVGPGRSVRGFRPRGRPRGSLPVSHSGPERWPCLSGGRDACLSLRPGLSPHAEPECPATRLLTEAWAGTGGGVWLRETPPWQLPSGHAPQRSAGQLRAGGRGPPDSCAPGTAAVA